MATFGSATGTPHSRSRGSDAENSASSRRRSLLAVPRARGDATGWGRMVTGACRAHQYLETGNGGHGAWYTRSSGWGAERAAGLPSLLSAACVRVLRRVRRVLTRPALSLRRGGVARMRMRTVDGIVHLEQLAIALEVDQEQAELVTPDGSVGLAAARLALLRVLRGVEGAHGCRRETDGVPRLCPSVPRPCQASRDRCVPRPCPGVLREQRERPEMVAS